MIQYPFWFPFGRFIGVFLVLGLVFEADFSARPAVSGLVVVRSTHLFSTNFPGFGPVLARCDARETIYQSSICGI